MLFVRVRRPFLDMCVRGPLSVRDHSAATAITTPNLTRAMALLIDSESEFQKKLKDMGIGKLFDKFVGHFSWSIHPLRSAACVACHICLVACITARRAGS